MENQEKTLLAKLTIDAYFVFMSTAQKPDFLDVFGRVTGAHFWEKWSGHNNASRFWLELDSPRRVMLAEELARMSSANAEAKCLGRMDPADFFK